MDAWIARDKIFMAMKNKVISIIEEQLKSFIEILRPTEAGVRMKLDFGYSWDGQTVLIFEIRPKWDDPSIILQHEVAKLRYIKTSKVWKVYWLRGSGNWELYKPLSEHSNLKSVLAEIENDKHHCFFG